MPPSFAASLVHSGAFQHTRNSGEVMLPESHQTHFCLFFHRYFNVLILIALCFSREWNESLHNEFAGMKNKYFFFELYFHMCRGLLGDLVSHWLHTGHWYVCEGTKGLLSDANCFQH